MLVMLRVSFSRSAQTMGEHGGDAHLNAISGGVPSTRARPDANAANETEVRSVSAPGWRRTAGGDDEMKQGPIPLAPNGANSGPVDPPCCHATPCPLPPFF